jgi:hypothetical protein
MQGAGLYRVTAVLTATSSTMPHLDTTQRRLHGHVGRSDPGLACICSSQDLGSPNRQSDHLQRVVSGISADSPYLTKPWGATWDARRRMLSGNARFRMVLATDA